MSCIPNIKFKANCKAKLLFLEGFIFEPDFKSTRFLFVADLIGPGLNALA